MGHQGHLKAQPGRGECLRELRIVSLLFVVDVVLLDSTCEDLQHPLGPFAAECKAVWMRVSTSKSEAMSLCWRRWTAPSGLGERYCLVLFTIDGTMECEVDRQIVAASVVKWVLLSICP